MQKLTGATEVLKSNLDQQDDAPQTQRFLRRPEVERLTGLTCSTLYEQMQRGTFPRPINISRRLMVWLEDDIARWQASMIAANKEIANRR